MRVIVATVVIGILAMGLASCKAMPYTSIQECYDDRSSDDLNWADGVLDDRDNHTSEAIAAANQFIMKENLRRRECHGTFIDWNQEN
eukprot:10742.XXX_166021_166409_1 [CDS] Oithona nana genome sequencing.